MQTLDSKDISVVIQGPIFKDITQKTIQSVRTKLPHAEIILSTWENSDVQNLDFDEVIFNKDPGGVLQKKVQSKLYCNLNRMIVSTNAGVKKCTRKYILKLRSDLILDNTKFLEVFEYFPNRFGEYKLFEKRILASTLFSKYSISNRKVAFHVSDWWFFGLATDVKKLLLSAEEVDEPYFSNYFEYPENKNKKTVYKKFDWKFAPEQYLCYSCFSKYYDDIKMEDCSDTSNLINEKSKICLINNFIFLEYEQSGIRNQKFDYSKYAPFYGELYLDLYTFYKFEKDYKNICDFDYHITSDSYIFENKDISSKLLRFYKHIFLLVNKKTKFWVRIEQLFFGVPSSIITLIPVFFNFLRRNHETK